MQFSFEFNAPHYCFLQIPIKKEISDYSLKNSDQNDLWFMHTSEKDNTLNNINQNTKAFREQAPVFRKSIKKQATSLEEMNLDQTRIRSNQESIQNNKKIQNQKVEIIIKMPVKTRGNAFRKTAIQLQKKQSIVKHFSSNNQEKTAHHNMPARSKSNLPKNYSNDIRPCPFPPRIQRQWQKKFAKKWYSLSPPSKLQAQKQMKQIQAEKNNDKSNLVKDNLFLRKQTIKRK